MKINRMYEAVPATSKVDIDRETGNLKRGEAQVSAPIRMTFMRWNVHCRSGKKQAKRYGADHGPSQAESMIRDAYSMGADEGVI